MNVFFSDRSPGRTELVVVGEVRQWAVLMLVEDDSPAFSNPVTEMAYRRALKELIIFAESTGRADHMIVAWLIQIVSPDNPEMVDGTFNMMISPKALLEKIIDVAENRILGQNEAATINADGETLH